MGRLLMSNATQNAAPAITVDSARAYAATRAALAPIKRPALFVGRP